jgi:hypothetical protein
MSKLAYLTDSEIISYPSIAKLFVEAWFSSDSKECLYKALDTNPQWVAWRLQRASEVQGYNTTRDAARSFHDYIRYRSTAMPLFSTLRDTTDTMTGRDMDEFIAATIRRAPLTEVTLVALRAQSDKTLKKLST